MATAAVGRVLAGGRGWSTAVKTRKLTMGSKMVRLICITTSASQKKSNVPPGPKQYTESFIKKQIEEFNLGKRHLANMMGEDPESFTQEDIDKAIAYLFPSGLFEKRARPFMKHPEEVFPKTSVIQWDEDGRPFNFLFYTGKQSYYSLMHEMYSKLLHIQNYQDQLYAQELLSENKASMNLIGSRWLIKEELEEMLVEKLSDQDYLRCIKLLERLVALSYCDVEEDYLLKFRKQLPIQSKKQSFEPLKNDEQGVAFSTAEGRRKSAIATATLHANGSGKFTINGDNYLLYFPVLQDREQLMFPFQFLDHLEKYDVVCSVSGGGRSGQAGAIRLAIARALCSFITEDEVEFMRQAGLLTSDPRVRERKKPGQEGARRKFTWKKR
ncbi:28S ribosomal protein S9, mitochondrial isoform X1 [Crotalus tigris]|uniref:28S ribosomal protein S9, mitochondrial isoform X1 n=2 Tax=Crotalus tigris TaxID=88082 RepID=UPI00192F1217|nr:28S ribosomal protein S9, mitochondrial isoform X1 [Crotalus tigris]